VGSSPPETAIPDDTIMDPKKLQAPLEKQLALLGFELVVLESAKEGRDSVLRLFIDHLDQDPTGGPTGARPVTLDDCVAANDGLVAWLDVEFPSLREDLSLEISSPGIERPLVKPDHFRRFLGRLCRIQTRMPLAGQKRFKGWILDVDDTAVTLEEDGVEKKVPFEEMQKARLSPFEEDKAPPSRLRPENKQPQSPVAGVETSAGKES
jgi:ribosome maturation factor RimP